MMALWQSSLPESLCDYHGATMSRCQRENDRLRRGG